MQRPSHISTSHGRNLSPIKISIFPHISMTLLYSQKMRQNILNTQKACSLPPPQQANICLNREECQFFERELLILGNLVTEGAIKPDPLKIKTIQAHKLPSTLKELRSFLGLENFCREYLPSLAKDAQPLYDLLKKKERGKSKNSTFHKQKASFYYIE